MVLIHIFAGLLAIVAGGVALSVLKGGTLHRQTGTIFVYTMLVMSGTGAGMAIVKAVALSPLPLGLKLQGDAMGGLLTFYLVVTALLTVRPLAPKYRWINVVANVAAFAMFVTAYYWGFDALSNANGRRGGYPAALYFIQGSIALLAAVGDWRANLLNGLKGAQRLGRHLWRMCFAMLIATASLFLGQMQVFPVEMRKPLLLMMPVLLVIGALLYWLVRISVPRWRPAARKQSHAPRFVPAEQS
ncbi:MAG: hypothetical protein HY255_04245 [Betaproteobacteria bacterium]|nr:hypothetical protein [Betaproteobacteria bacterium]